MLTLATADTIAIGSDLASKVNVTIFGMELNGSTEAYKVLYQGRAGSYPALVLADSPTGYWRLGETGGSSAVDASGNGNTGTFGGGVAAPTLGVTGLLVGDSNLAAQWDGDVSYSDVAVDSVATIFDGTKSWTIEAWINATPDGSFRYIFSATSATPLLDVSLTSANSALYLARQSAGGIDECIGAALSAGLHHVVATYDASNLRLYVDGALWAGPTASTRSTPTATEASIGNYAPSQAVPFNGVIDEVAVYASALSAARVLIHYNGGPNAGTVYTVPASNIAEVKSIHAVNTDTSARTLTVYRGGTAAANQITPTVSIPAGCAATYEDGFGWKLLAGGVIAAGNKQVFTDHGPWVKPSTNPGLVFAVCVGGGGGGGGASAGTGAAIRGGGSGGGGGGYAWKALAGRDLAGVESATVGVGGGGGIGRTAGTGLAGAIGSQSIFGVRSVVTAGGGGGGGAGAVASNSISGGAGGGSGEANVALINGTSGATNANSTGGSPKPTAASDAVAGSGGSCGINNSVLGKAEWGGGAGGGTGTSQNPTVQGKTSIHGGGGGGNGTSADATPTLFTGQDGGDVGLWGLGGGGAAGTDGASPTSGTPGADGTSLFSGKGGGGGGGTITASTNGADGGAGGAVGGGGGGGGDGTNTGLGGNGGNGGRGEIRVYSI